MGKNGAHSRVLSVTHSTIWPPQTDRKYLNMCVQGKERVFLPMNSYVWQWRGGKYEWWSESPPLSPFSPGLVIFVFFYRSSGFSTVDVECVKPHCGFQSISALLEVYIFITCV